MILEKKINFKFSWIIGLGINFTPGIVVVFLPLTVVYIVYNKWALPSKWNSDD